MKQIRFLLATLALLLVCGTVQAQFGRRLGRAVENAAKRTVERKAEQKTEEAVGKAIDKATDPDTYKDKDGDNESKDDGKASKSKKSSSKDDADEPESEDAVAAAPQQGVKAAEMAYAKSDFVPGDEIIFEDNIVGEQLGEFPSLWELHRGNAEIATLNGQNVINMLGKDSWLEPLMKNPKNYLGDMFTVEFDVWQPNKKQSGSWEIDFMTPTAYLDHDVFTLTFSQWDWESQKGILFHYGWENNNGRSSGSSDVKIAGNAWQHIAFSFNKRALKIYINGVRVANVPNVKEPPGWFTIWTGHGEEGDDKFIRNVRIAKGAVPLYDRMTTDGKIITYGITFDVGKSTIKPESMGEINRIAKLMADNPDLKFSVEGHTDSTGSAATNQKLSDERSAAVVAKLIEMGIAKDRLTSAGKGQTAPIADNATDEGRAKNRRVEFVKVNQI